MNLESVRHHYLRRVVAPAMRLLGPRISVAAARRLARGVFEMNPPGRPRAERRWREVIASRRALPDVSPAVDAAELASRMYQHVGRFWAEALFIPSRLQSAGWRRHVHVTGEEGLRSLATSRRGCILATAYYGNLAAAACALGHLFKPVHVVVDRFAQPVLASWQRELYAQPWVEPVERREAAAALPRVLSDGGAVLMVCEHERHRGRGVEARFCGRTLNCYPTLGRLARWFDVPIGVVTCRARARPLSFALELHETIESEPGSDADARVVRRTLAALERAILEEPEQYLWSLATPPITCHPASAST